MSPETNEVIINNKTGEITDKPLIMGDASKPLTEEELNGIVSQLISAEAQATEAQKWITISRELIARHMEAIDATKTITSDYVISLPVQRVIDPNLFQAEFGEDEIFGDLFSEVFTPEQEVTTLQKAKVDGRKIRGWWSMGDEVKARLEKCIDVLSRRPSPRPSIEIRNKNG